VEVELVQVVEDVAVVGAPTHLHELLAVRERVFVAGFRHGSRLLLLLPRFQRQVERPHLIQVEFLAVAEEGVEFVVHHHGRVALAAHRNLPVVHDLDQFERVRSRTERLSVVEQQLPGFDLAASEQHDTVVERMHTRGMGRPVDRPVALFCFGNLGPLRQWIRVPFQVELEHVRQLGRIAFAEKELQFVGNDVHGVAAADSRR